MKVVDAAEARALRVTAAAMRENLKPFPRLTVSEWADANRELPDTSAEPGQWRTNRTPYLRGIMDAACEPEVERVVWVKPAQVGGSEALMNVLGYFIDQDPAPIMLVQISSGEADKFSKERVAPMIASTPALAAKVTPARTRDSGNTIDSKAFPGGHLGIVGANAPSGLRSRPRRVLLADEVDGYPPSAGVEGAPLELARKRLSTFWNSLEFDISTPTVRDFSLIEDLANECDEIRRYHVPCPHCGELQILEWGGKDARYGVKWETGPDGKVTDAWYLCRSCAVIIEEHQKFRMIADEKAGGRARWIADVRKGEDGVELPAHPHPTRVAFHLNALCSPWLTWAELAQEWLDAQGNPLKLQVFVNTRLAETWDERGQTLDADPLMKRRKPYTSSPLPAGVVLLTAGVDVQADRLEMEIVGWGLGEESWSLEYLRIPGDPSVQKLWQDLDHVLARTWEHPAGTRLRIGATCVDSQYATQQVLKYAKDRLAMNVWAIGGREGYGRPIIDRPSKNTKGRVPKYPVGVDTAKAVFYQQLLIDEPGPGFCHFPEREGYDEEHFKQLTAEKRILRLTAGNRMKPVWVRRPQRRAEALDCRVYAIAAKEGLLIAGVRLETLKAQLEVKPAEGPRPPKTRGGGTWATGWKR